MKITNTFPVGWKPQNYEARVGSVRIRCLNTIAELRHEGFPIELFREKKTYALVVFSKTYKDSDIELAARLKASGTRVVFDICDNHFLKEPERVDRLHRMLQACDQCVVSSDAMKSVICEKMGDSFSTAITVISDAVETSLTGSILNIKARVLAEWQFLRFLRQRAKWVKEERFQLVWFGNHKGSYDSGMPHMQVMQPMLEALNQSSPISLTVISNSREYFEQVFSDWNIPLTYIDWSPMTFFRVMKYHSVTLIPIGINDFTKVKTNNRLLQSLYLGVGVVASQIDSYKEFSDCTVQSDWQLGLEAYIKDPDLLETHVKHGQEIIKQRYMISHIAAEWRKFFLEAVE
ncbi:MAG: hypothetical protein V3W04_15635 [Gammaproteobacteria bacterium]